MSLQAGMADRDAGTVRQDLGGRAVFQKIMSDPILIPDEGIERAVDILRSGRLFRYGEDTGAPGETALFEAEFAAYIGRSYALGVNSCGCSLFLALKALGAEPGEPILCNAFTLAPVPGAIAHAQCRPVMVDMESDLTISLSDLEAKIKASGARILLLSYMRGHFGDIGALMALCRAHGVQVIEDCAHTLGAYWDGRLVGTFGDVACFSSQTFKHINSGEGGILATDLPEVAARAIIMSGSYMMYGQNGARPPLEVFESIRDHTPNFSMRMTDTSAALLRPQLAQVASWAATWNETYRRIEAGLATIPHCAPIVRDPREAYVGSSIQFVVQDLAPEAIQRFSAEAAAHGVFLKWFGAARTVGFTSRYDQWAYAAPEASCPQADKVLARLIDMRLPLTLTSEDCALIVQVLREAMQATNAASPGAGDANQTT